MARVYSWWLGCTSMQTGHAMVANGATCNTTPGFQGLLLKPLPWCPPAGPHLALEARQPVDCSMEINGQQQHPLSAAAAVAAGVAGPGIKQEIGQEQLPAQHGQAASAEDQAALQLAMRLGSGQGGSGTDLQRARELAAWMNQNGIGADALDTLKALLNPSSAVGGQDRPGRTSGSCKPSELGRASLGACGGPDASGGPNASKVVRRSLVGGGAWGHRCCGPGRSSAGAVADVLCVGGRRAGIEVEGTAVRQLSQAAQGANLCNDVYAPK